MHSNLKEWLVRTRSGEILGPFSARELLEELRRATFTVEDEIAPSRGHWVSAQSLANHDVEEVTHTSTRNQTITPTPTTRTYNPDANPNGPSVTMPPGTPVPPPNLSSHSSHRMSPLQRRVVPTLTAIVILIGIWALMLQTKKKSQQGLSSPIAGYTGATEGESPFVRQIYQMIRVGDSVAALKQLTEYHEKRPNHNDVEYLIPYASLLILEGDSTSRAKKYLEQVLSSTNSPSLKSRAHHWMGYLLLSQDEADMGESHFLEALQLNPKDAAARFNLGRTYLKQEKFSQALDYLTLAELEVPELWLVHIYKGQAKVALGNMEEARQAFRTAVSNSPDRWIGYIYQALFQMGIHENDAARDTLKKMLTRDPRYEVNSPPPMGYYQEKVNYNEYLTAFQQVMEKASSEDRDIGKLYLHFLMNGGTGSELKRIDAVATKGGLLSKVIALKVLLDSEAKADDLKGALARLPQNLSEFGPYAYVLRGDAKARLGQLNEAISEFQKAIMLEPSSAIAHLAYANVLKKLDRRDEAQKQLNTLLTYHPNYIPAILPAQNF
jgi:tetratricopeptide (TPR) repeat protein